MRKVQFSLTHRVIIAFIAILLPLFAVFYYDYLSSREQIEGLVLDTLQILAAEREKNFLLFLEMNKERIRDFSNDRTVLEVMEHPKASSAKELGEYLSKSTLPLETAMDELALFSPEGALVASTVPVSGRDVSGEDFFISGLNANSVTENATVFGRPGLVFSAPITSMGGKKTIGVVAGFLPASMLNSVMKGVHATQSVKPLLLTRWETIETYLVNRDKVMITESRFIKDAPFRAEVLTHPVDACVNESREIRGFYPDYRGVRVAGASTCLPEYKWTLIAEIDEDEALEDLKDTRLYAAGAFLAVFGLVAFLVIYFLRFVVKPLKVFSSASIRIAGGDYDISVPVRSNDEIGVLSEAFNSMAKGIKERSEALALSSERLSNAQRIAHIGNWDWDIVKNKLHWSDETYRMFGVSKTGFGVSYETFLDSVHPDDRELIKAAVNDALLAGRSYSIDHRIVLPSGEVRIVHEQAEITHDDAGKPVMLSGTVQDITERKTAEDEVRKLNAELEDKVRERTAELEAAMKGLESFSYSVAHDLRAPLRTIDGFSQAFMEDYGENIDAQGHDYLRRIREGSQRMGLLIDDLLTLSHVTRMEMRREAVDLTHLAEAVAAEQKKVSEREVECIIAQGLKAVGDPGLLRIVLVNLISNAFKFTGKTQNARIEFFSVGKEDGRTVYCVRDNGVGFDMKYYGKLFVPFQRLHSSSDFMGTGIGLATVERIIGRHGGRVWAEGETGKGAAFYFTL